MAAVNSPLLADALRDRYVLERELGRGGMAVVYLAHDLRHDRSVALKVLHRELAQTLGPERFDREIKLAARLQHPHILTVLDSGESAGQLWFTMPYVEGQTLRDRLRREGQISVEEALRITREAAQALGYAHEHGIIHRDVKPENILLTIDGNILLADFGIARALQDVEALTQTGLVVGTPAYMSPEQATGEHTVNARADVYSLGCVLYEMLAGEPPYTGPTAQAVIAKRFHAPIPSVRHVRPEIPARLDEVLHRALAVSPADRVATMMELTEALAFAETPPSGAEHPPPSSSVQMRRRLPGSVVPLVVCSLLGFGALYAWRHARSGDASPRVSSLLGQGILAPRERVLVADFQNHTRDSLLGGAVTEALRVDLAQSRAVRVMSTQQVQAARQRMQPTGAEPLSDSLAREVALREGVKAFVSSDIASVGPRYDVSVQLVAAETGEVLAAFRETAADSTGLLPAVDRVSEALRRRIGESMQSVRAGRPLEQVTTGSLRALRLYSQAQRAISGEGNRSKGVALLQEAVSLDTSFAMAYTALGYIFNAIGEAARTQDAITRAFRHRDRLTEREYYFVSAAYYDGVKHQPERAIAAYRALLDRDSLDLRALHNLSYMYGGLRDYAKSEEFDTRAMRLDSTSHDLIWIGIQQAQLNQGKLADTRKSLDRAHALFPGDLQFEYVEIYLAGAQGDYAGVERHAHAMMEKFPQDPIRVADGWRTLANVALLHGRLAASVRYRREAMQAAERAGLIANYLQDAVALADLEIRIRGSRPDGLRRLREAFARHPLESVPPSDRPYETLARSYAAGGMQDRARALLLDFERNGLRVGRAGEAAHAHMEGALAASEGRYPEGGADLRQAAEVDECPICTLPELARAYELDGQPDSATAVYQRYLSTPWMYHLELDAIYLESTYTRLAALYGQRNEREKAAALYHRALALWKDADPELQPQVSRIRRRLAALALERVSQ